ncbi:type VI secretion system secreted protein Hcp [Paracoccus isoporae]|uniref:Type VI secretion system secreted protein Hcp n=1 Tax=Paracoccus isoporae TaxID=591205 RepID=A0A1G7D8H3_9RHOB|nr:type VI secretion system tube protein Hcp [Paracoccus isoporae]SDE47809.1 type VI secretion system secreted protein Hcp [Paracoccus isoporae]
MSFSGYYKIDDIPGESKRSDHEDEIVISSFSWGASRSAFRNSGGQRESGLADIQSLSISKDYDCSSPYIALACIKAKNLGETVLTLRKDQGDDHSDYLTITMTNTLVENYQVSGGGGGNPVDAITLSFDTIKMKYLVDADDLTKGDEHEIEYDVLAAK